SFLPFANGSVTESVNAATGHRPAVRSIVSLPAPGAILVCSARPKRDRAGWPDVTPWRTEDTRQMVVTTCHGQQGAIGVAACTTPSFTSARRLPHRAAPRTRWRR